MTLEACTAIRPPTSTLDRTTGTTHARTGGSLPDVFVPDLGMLVDERLQQTGAGIGIEVDHGHAGLLAQPVEAALERPRLPDHHGPDPELPDQPTAVPAGSECRDHDRVPVRAPPPGVLERGGLAVHRRAAVLHPAVVPAAEQRAVLVKERGADRHPALRPALARLLERDLQHRRVVSHCRHHPRRAVGKTRAICRALVTRSRRSVTGPGPTLRGCVTTASLPDLLVTH